MVPGCGPERWAGRSSLRWGWDCCQRKTADTPKAQHAQGVKLFLSSFAVSITNSAAILTFLFAFSWFGLDEGMGPLDGALLVTGVFIGTYIWWFTLSAGVVALKKKMEKYSLRTIEMCFGGVLLGFSLCCP
ncbi:LysE family transporter [Acutalibacter muris]|uniref:LysE family transporter n=1 Tax=Acutalibacter muris TaxID=1796620 RepID=UPI0020CFCBB7|nr:LysE family transporter [Acutalibacter muris]